MRHVCCDPAANVLLAGAMLWDAQWLTRREKHLELGALDAATSFSEHRSALPKTLLDAIMQTEARECRVEGGPRCVEKLQCTRMTAVNPRRCDTPDDALTVDQPLRS